MRKLIIFILSLCLFLTLLANDELSKHRLSLDFGGPGAIATFEYQYQIHSKNMHSLSFTAGMGMAGLIFSFPVGVNYTFGDKNQLLAGMHFVPLTTYALSGTNTDWITSYWISPRIGYRRIIHMRKESIYLQTYFSPLIELNGGRIMPWAGLGFGVYL
jgi:hypothetical protein